MISCLLALVTLARAEPGESPAQLPGGSLWDFVEPATGTVVDDEEREAAAELAAERFAARSVAGEAWGREPELSLYLDPVGALESDPLHADRIDPSEFDLPVVFNERVAVWMRYFLGRGRDWYERYLERSTAYLPMMHRELDAADLPRDLVYVSMIESGFSTKARSYASAVGLWQFIASTGRYYGLRVDSWVDQRRDPLLSTRAAAAYLSDLHDTFDDWYLAFAAYNTGPGRVQRAMRRENTRDYWKLVDAEALHSQTMNYVPKILAAAIIGKHPERYGFTGLDYQDELTVDTVTVDGSVTVDVLARLAGTSTSELERLNPALLRGATPPDDELVVHVPRGRSGAFLAALEALPPEDRVSYQRHTVARGESLGSIARRYGVGLSELASFNKITDPDRIYVGMELQIPVAGSVPVAAATASKPKTTTIHTVRAGETLAAIASRYGTDVKTLQADNGLADADHIVPGQRLRVQGEPTAAVEVTHVVAKGDTLSGIAAAYGVGVADVKRWNELKSSTIHPGQRLTILGSRESWTSYTVRAGDSLTRIARAQGCSVAELKSWNELDSSTIHPGQTLRIKRN